MALQVEPWGEAEVEGAAHCCSVMGTSDRPAQRKGGGGEEGVVKVPLYHHANLEIFSFLVNTCAAGANTNTNIQMNIQIHTNTNIQIYK